MSDFVFEKGDDVQLVFFEKRAGVGFIEVGGRRFHHPGQGVGKAFKGVTKELEQGGKGFPSDAVVAVTYFAGLGIIPGSGKT
jgi:hypothetical protein